MAYNIRVCILLIAFLAVPLVVKDVCGRIIIVDDDKGDWAQYQSIQDAIDNSTDGDTIRVFAGSYNEQLFVNRSVTIIGNGTAVSVINGGGNGTVVTINHDGVTFTDFGITNSSSSFNDSGIHLENCSHVLLRNISVHRNLFGVYLFRTNHSRLINLTSENNTEDGIFVYRSSNNTFQGVTSTKNTGNGVHISTSSSYNAFQNLRCVDNDKNGLLITYDSDYNVILSGEMKYNYLSGVAVRINSEYNLFNYTEIVNNEGRGFYVSGMAGNVLMNSSVQNNDWTDISVEDGASFTAINVSYSADYCDTESTFWYKNYLHIRLVDLQGSPLSGDVRIKEGSKVVYSTPAFGGTDPQTGDDGFLRWIPVTFKYTQSSITTYPTVSVWVRFRGWKEKRTVNMSSSHTEEYTFPVRGPTLYVDDDNADDPDMNGSADHPFDTIEGALLNATENWTLKVSTGNYSSASVSIPISLSGSGPETVINALSSAMIVSVRSNLTNMTVIGGLSINASECLLDKLWLRNGVLTIGGADNILTRSILQNVTVVLEADDNVIYDNHMLYVEVFDNRTNQWNVSRSAGTNIVGGPYIGGNFWADYFGEDADRDYIADEPYRIDSDTYDYLPLLPPSTPPVLHQPKVSPAVGSYRIPRNFTVLYQDINNELPTYVEVIVDNTSHALLPLDDNDTFVRDGKEYYLVMNLTAGNHTFYFSADDGTYSINTTQMWVVCTNSPPTLNLSVSPSMGSIITEFTFTVDYSDYDGDPPQGMTLTVEWDENSTGLTLHEADINDTDYMDGKTYLASSRFIHYAIYNCTVVASDGMTEASDSTRFTVFNAPPELRGGSEPTTGYADTEFKFTLNYTDTENHPPVNVTLILDGISYAMDEADADDLNYSDGKLYQLSILLSKGDHIYYFEAEDVDGAVNSTPPKKVKVKNTLPEIINISTHVEAGRHNFTVLVRDVDHEKPAYVRLVLENETYEMSFYASSDENLTWLYFRAILLEEGRYHYYIQVGDGIGVDVSNTSVLIITGYPRLLHSAVSPSSPCSADEIEFSVIYMDAQGRPPQYVWLVVDGDVFIMEGEAGNYTEGVRYSVVIHLHRGQHEYYFNTSNAVFFNSTPVLPLMVNNTPPEIRVRTYPENATPGESVLFRLEIRDVDGDAPTVDLMVGGKNVSLIYEGEDEDVHLFSSSIVLMQGYHLYEATASDGYDSTSIRGRVLVDSIPELSAFYIQIENSQVVVITLNYSDADNDSASYLRAYLDGVEVDVVEISPSDVNTSDGKTYKISVTLDPGVYNLTVLCNDTLVEVSRVFELTVLKMTNSPPLLSNWSIMPESPRGRGEVIFRVYYLDGDGDIPADIEVVVDGVPHSMVIESGKLWDGVYVGSVMLKEGMHTYYFRANDGQNMSITPLQHIKVVGEGSASTTLDLLIIFKDLRLLLIFTMCVSVAVGAIGVAVSRRKDGVERSVDLPSQMEGPIPHSSPPHMDAGPMTAPPTSIRGQPIRPGPERGTGGRPPRFHEMAAMASSEVEWLDNIPTGPFVKPKHMDEDLEDEQEGETGKEWHDEWERWEETQKRRDVEEEMDEEMDEEGWEDFDWDEEF